jgi:DNA-binding CsgD family transcriptional regulator
VTLPSTVQVAVRVSGPWPLLLVCVGPFAAADEIASLVTGELSLPRGSCHDSDEVTGQAVANEGFEALARADWEVARERFEAALGEGDESPELLDAFGRALWWLREPEAAVVQRERAYAGFRRARDLRRAARIALWLSREYAQVWRNEAAANGWLARAERLLQDVAAGAESGWLALARSERARDPATATDLASTALAVAVLAGDSDLELRALAQLGLAEVSRGAVDEGLAHLDEAMAAATGGESPSLETFADVCCTLLQACTLAGDDGRPKQWAQVFESFARSYDHVPLLAFCRSCGAGVSAASGRIDEAERELVAALRDLTEAGQRGRCAHPAARLAEIRVLQGRLSEAEQLLAGFEAEPEALQALVALRLARSEGSAAAALLERRLREVGDTLLAAPLLARLVQAKLAAGDRAAARSAAQRAARIAARTASDRVRATAALARGLVAAADGDGALPALEEAVELFARARLPLDAARTRLELARALSRLNPGAAVDQAVQARRELASLGADRDADAAARLLRALGVRGRSGPRDHGVLSKREVEVLRLLGEGLSNAEIAARLFISPKTAEHHVGRIYAKLELRGRAEAAAYATRELGVE